MEHIINLFGKERAKSYLWRSFALSWLIWNWRIFVVLFWYKKKDLSGQNYIDYIQENLMGWCNTFIIPLIMTATFLFGVAYIDNWIDEFKKRRERDKRNKALKISEGEKPTREEFNSLKNEIEGLRKINTELNFTVEKQTALNETLSERIHDFVNRNDFARINGEYRVKSNGVLSSEIIISGNQLKGKVMKLGQWQDFNGIMLQSESINGELSFIVKENNGVVSFFRLKSKGHNFYGGEVNGEPVQVERLT